MSSQEKVFKKSRFAYEFKRGLDTILYHSVLLKTLSLDEKELKTYKLFNQPKKIKEVTNSPESAKTIEGLVSTGFLVNPEKDEAEIFREHFRTRAKFSLGLMYLLTTDDCNFRCGYCFEQIPKNKVHKNMSLDIVQKAIDFFISGSLKHPDRRILFYGGEPLLNKDAVFGALDYLKSRYSDEKIKLTLVTNGSLIDTETARELCDDRLSISVSIDGPKEVHDKIRKQENGNSTFDLARRGYFLLRYSGVKNLGISLTIASHNADKLKDNVEYLVEEFQPSSFGFNFLLDLPCCANPFGVPIDYATEKSIEAFKFLRERGIFEDRAMRKIKAFVNENIHLKDCGGVGNQIVVAPNGRIGPCHAFLNHNEFYPINIQNINLTDLINNPVFLEWSERYPLNMGECLDCEAIGVCGGGCPYQSYLSEGSIWALDKRMCQHNKDFLTWLIWDVYDSRDTQTKF